MITSNRDYIYCEDDLSVLIVAPTLIEEEYWQVIESSYHACLYEFCDQRYLDGGVHIAVNRNLMSFYLKLRHSYFLVALKGKKLVGFSELYFGNTPIEYINKRKLDLCSSGNICFSNITIVVPDCLRNGVSLTLEKAKELLCRKFNVKIIMSLICIKPIPNIASLSRAKKLGAYFTGSTFLTKRRASSSLGMVDVEYTEVLYPVDKSKKIFLDCANRLIVK